MEDIENLKKDKLISFLQNIIILIEQNKINSKQYQSIIDFYTCYKFKERKKEIIFSDDDYLKFLTMGWFIYSQIQSNL